MKKLKKNNIVNFPTSLTDGEKEIEASKNKEFELWPCE